MKGIVFFIIAVAILLASIALYCIMRRKKNIKNRVLKPVNYLMAGVFLSSAVLFLPVYFYSYGASLGVFQKVILSLHHGIKLFVVDADFDIVLGFTTTLNPLYGNIYEIFFVLLYLSAPVLTFGFLLSFFKDASAAVKLFFRRASDWYVFSDLNERSVTLAEDVVAKKKRATIVFTDIHESGDDNNELIERASELRPIVFKKSVSAINVKTHSKKYKLNYFIIGDKEEENISSCSEVINKYKDVKNSHLYLFSTTKQSELFLKAIFAEQSDIREELKQLKEQSDEQSKTRYRELLKQLMAMKILRIRESESLINRFLFDNGDLIIDGAHAVEDGLNVISAVVVGLGKYGREMSKALPWFCQLPDYKFKMNVIDKDQHAEDRFAEMCPDFLNPEINKKRIDGESQYDITVHSGIDYDTRNYGECLEKIKDASLVFIALGSDEDNVSCAAITRKHFERIGIHPKIITVVFDEKKAKLLSTAKEIDKKEYDIDCIGSLKQLYSVDVILNSELEEKAFKVHLGYNKNSKEPMEKIEKDFWENEYNYNSSCASAIHNKIRVKCKISGADKDEEDLTPAEEKVIKVVEHRRWNAYLRSRGYIYSKSPERASRNDLAKKHNCLIPYEGLSEEIKQLDLDVGTKK